MAKKRNAFVPLAGDLDPNSPDFIETLNDRLRRVAQQSATETRFKDIVGTMNAGQLPPEVPTTSDLPDGTIPRVVAKELVESGVTDNGQRVSILSRILSMMGFGVAAGIEFAPATGNTATTKSRIFRAIDQSRFDITTNAWYDAAAAAWNRDDVAQMAFADVSNTAAVRQFRAAPAAANPITWNIAQNIYPDGSLALNIKRDVLANIPTLGASDANYLFYETATCHLLRWTGTAWEFAFETGAHPIEGHIVAPAAGYQLCNGAACNYLTIVGGVPGLVAFTTPNLTGAPEYAKFGAAYAGVGAAVAPTLSGSTATAATGITNPAATGASATGVTTQNDNNGWYATTTGSNNVAPHTHNHAITDPTHTHTIGAPTDPSHLHAVGTLVASATGEPAHVTLLPYFRL